MVSSIEYLLDGEPELAFKNYDNSADQERTEKINAVLEEIDQLFTDVKDLCPYVNNSKVCEFMYTLQALYDDVERQL